MTKRTRELLILKDRRLSAVPPDDKPQDGLFRNCSKPGQALRAILLIRKVKSLANAEKPDVLSVKFIVLNELEGNPGMRVDAPDQG